jgi:methylmalonyl-CoA mutase
VDIAHRRFPITGVSEFPNVAEQPVERDPWPDRPTGGLNVHRYAGSFEVLRDRSDAAPTRPKVFLAALGPVAAHSARVGFASNLFQAGGFEVITTGDFATSGAFVACICSSDSIYAGAATTEVVQALRVAGAPLIWLAGTSSLRIDGVDGYVHAGVDAIDVLTRSLEAAGA